MTHRLEIRLLNYFTLIVLAASVIAIEFFVEINNSKLLAEISLAPLSQTQTTIQDNVVNLRNKIVIMLGILTLVVAIIMLMFIKNISSPLKKMATAAEKINNGDLTQIISIENDDEIGLVGKAINELTSNLQEVAVFTSATAELAIRDFDKIKIKIENQQLPSTDEIDELELKLKSLKTFIDSFQLLQTEINK